MRFQGYCLVSFLFLASGTGALANSADPQEFCSKPNQDERCLTLESAVVEESLVRPLVPRSVSSPGSLSQLGDLGGPEIGAALKTADQILNLGGKVWKFIVANQPVVNVKNTPANALPKGVTSADQLEGWKAPLAHRYHVTYKNLYNMKVVDFTYDVIYTSGGSLEGKRGEYLSDIRMVPAKLNVIWGFRFDFSGEVTNVTNVGTKANPIAAAQLLAGWTVSSPIQHHSESAGYYVRGDGEFEAVPVEEGSGSNAMP